jgi:predicted dehydrogenase
MSGILNRREFSAWAASSAAAAASGRVRLGVIGCGGRGRELIRILAQFPDTDVAAVSDVIEPRMEEARLILANAVRPQQTEMALDYRRILDRKDIDGIVLATTQHWHGIPFIQACQAKKPVYVEKPLSHTVAEGRAMVAAARKSGVLALMGTQQRSGPPYKKAVEIVRSGRLGKIGLVESWNYSNTGQRTGKFPDSDPPPGYHWNEWLGPAPAVPFNRSRLNNSWWFDYSGGMLTNWAIHHIDIILWAMDYPKPTEVSAIGGKYVVDDMADTYDTLECSWQFPGWLMTYRYRGFNTYHTVLNRKRFHGIIFFGSKGTLVVDRFGYELYEETQPDKLAEKMDGVPWLDPRARNIVDAKTGVRTEQDGPYQKVFIDAIKTGARLEPSLEESHQGTVCCHLGNIAYRVGRRIRWDAGRETIPADAQAAALLDKTYRKGFELPGV